MIETLKHDGRDPYNYFIKALSKTSIQLALFMPVSKLTDLQYGDTFDLNGTEITFHGTPQKLKELRKASKYTPLVFAMNNKEIRALENDEIISINPDNGEIRHGRCGSGPKQKLIQNNSER
jgi:hypothetical protein